MGCVEQFVATILTHRKGNMSETSCYIGAAAESVEISAPAKLRTDPDVAFNLGQSPDGLPMVLHIRRRLEVRAAIMSALRYPEVIDPQIERAINLLEKSVEVMLLSKGIHHNTLGSYYGTNNTVVSLLGATLMSRMLGAVSPMAMPDEHSTNKAESRIENSALFSLHDLQAVANQSGAEKIPSTLSKGGALISGQNSKLFVNLNNSEVTLGGTTGDASNNPSVSGRTVVFESLLALVSARYFIRDSTNRTYEGRLSETTKYMKALRPASSLGWSVAKVDVAWLIFELARSIDKQWHSKQLVHGDLKPANVLLCKDSINAFDALEVPAGQMSLGMTASWAAPEQILARAVTPATDVFALALMLTSLLQAVIYGEEKSMVIPAVGSGRRRIRMICDPEVWVDPTIHNWSAKTRVLWREFLMKCLAHDPSKRPQSGNEFAEQLELLLRKEPIEGRLQVSCGPGRLEFLVGSKEPVWVLSDFW